MKLSRILLATCMFAPLAVHAETPKHRTVAVIEEAGCVLDASNVNEVLDGLGLSDEEFRVIGEELVAEGLADVSEMGVFRLTSPNCPSAPLNAHAGTPKDRTVAVIEEAGCVLDRSNINEILDGLALSDEEFRAIGEELIADGLAEVSEMGAFKLTTPFCASAE